MAFTLGPKTIKCPNCFYEGRAEVKGTGFGTWLTFLIFCAIAATFPILFAVVPIFFIWLVFKPAEHICPRCKYPYPIQK